jgi:hypothetical protein
MVFFDWDSSRLSPASLNVITQAVTAFRSTGNARVTATGHTDTTGPESYNMALSLRRANAVKTELVRQGVPADAIAVVGKGETQLLVQTGDQVREPQNRRVEIAIAGQMATAPVAVPPPLDYCRRLAALYRRNVATNSSDVVAGNALARCEAGAYDEGVPTLERLLTNARVQLPPRGY